MMKDVDSWLSHFFAENNDVFCLLAGVLLIIGAWKNWNWLCDPVGKPYNILDTWFASLDLLWLRLCSSAQWCMAFVVPMMKKSPISDSYIR